MQRTGRARYGKWHLSTKGYPRYHTGAYRGQYVHRVAMSKHLARRNARLVPSQDVHHKNHNKLDWRIRNLQVIDHALHGYISAKQRWYLQHIVEPARKKQWDEYFGLSEDVSFDVTQF